jgi:hypothetical protein
MTLVEVAIAAAVAVLLGWMLIALTHATVLAASHLDARVSARSAVERLAERVQSDAAGAWSVFVLSVDLFHEKAVFVNAAVAAGVDEASVRAATLRLASIRTRGEPRGFGAC